MSRLRELHDEQGQSPWLDNLRRDWLRDGRLESWIERGVRGLTSNPTIFQKAISGSDLYDEQFGAAISTGSTPTDAYWDLVIADIRDAAALLAPLHAESGGSDGFVSVEVDPALAHDAAGTVVAARELSSRIGVPNLLLKIPATSEGLGAVEQLVAEGFSVNVTLIFGLERYEAVIEAYLRGLEQYAGDLSRVAGVASFFVSRVDSEIDKRLDALATEEARRLRGRAAIAQARAAYAIFTRRFSGPRWEALTQRGARLQRPLWASTSTKDPTYPDTLYVDSLIGPDTVNTLPEATLEAFEEHGILGRTLDSDIEQAHEVLSRLGAIGIDVAQVSDQLELEGVEAFRRSFDDLLSDLAAKAEQLRW